MRPFHMSLAIVVALVWGLNFIFIQYALNDLPPFLLCALRFIVVSIPAVFFIKRPPLAWPRLFCFSLTCFMLQFVFLFAGIASGIPPGLAPVIAQTQIFFSLIFAALFLSEQPHKLQILGAVIAFSGIVVVGLNVTHGGTLIGFLLILCAALASGWGNIMLREVGSEHALSMVAWGCFLGIVPLCALSYYLEGWPTIIHSLQHMSWTSIGSLFYIAYISTWLGYGLWNWLVGQYMLATVVPFILLVPFTGMIAAFVFLGEPLQNWKLGAGILVILGLCINIFGPHFAERRLATSIDG